MPLHFTPLSVFQSYQDNGRLIITHCVQWNPRFHDFRLSLLTMTSPNQLCDVLLFVCSKMADETNLSSKVPVADRTIEV